ncbi:MULTISPECIES: roadblock/LC7 domain-containing protein [Actinomadura]|uniref:Roadblock/LC7 domain-containing protein n=2 Tax=Actinomadura TaxID=1988 RepID=A0A5D0NEU6_9ACTN|nr:MULTISPECIES: roadblock/LC7 domain-containing protein [Actinomadura]TYB42829.1 roadblock/LC7 domain-containing protein [Actinomadura chibensis]TYK45918.1 roadblock/LC7 domain-containing protein [Actinomadura decatromicini]
MSGQDLNWLVTNFADRVAKVAHAVVVSSDGLPMAYSSGFPPERADQLSAIASGLMSLTQGAAKIFDAGGVNQTVVEMDRGLLFVMSITNGSVFAVLAAPDCDLGLVAYEMTLLVERVGRVLTPALRAQDQQQPPFSGPPVTEMGAGPARY